MRIVIDRNVCFRAMVGYAYKARLHDNLLRIAERYNFKIPTITDIVLNRYVKDILKRLSETVPSLLNIEVAKLHQSEEAGNERLF